MNSKDFITSKQRKSAAAPEAVESFEIFPWISDFETSIVFIDEQHKALVHLLNVLANYLVVDSASLSFDEVLSELSEYATYHFEAEEALMRQFIGGDALEAEHQLTHRVFVEEISQLRERTRTKPARKKIEGIVAFLSRWLAHHILDTDRRMALVIRAVQAGMPLEAAKTQADLEMSGAIMELIGAVLAIYEKLSSRSLQLMQEIAAHKEGGRAPVSMQQAEWEHIQHVLLNHDGNISAAARTLHISRRTLQRKLRKPCP